MDVYCAKGDYTVNYQIGRVKILDPALGFNVPIQISVENNTFFGQQNKRFSGFDLTHQFNEKVAIEELWSIYENPPKKRIMGPSL